jgi:predicted metal-dependent peptidase
VQLGGRLPPEKRLHRAILGLCEDEPFYGSVAVHLDTRATDALPTAGVLPGEGTLLFDPDFVDGLSDPQLRGLVAHEVLHLVLEFGERRGERDPERWNTAQDVVINHALVEDGFTLPPGGVIPDEGRIEAGPVVVERIGSKTSESVYDELADAAGALSDLSGPNRRAVADDGGNDTGGTSAGTENRAADDSDAGSEGADGEDGEGPGDGREERYLGELAEENPGGFDVHPDGESHDRPAAGADVDGGPDWERLAVEAAQAARRAAAERGTTPAGVVERIEARTSESVDWRSLLRERIAGSLPSGYTWWRPADKSRAAGAYLPATESRRLEAVVALDTSGSMTAGGLELALGHLRSLESEYDDLDLTLVQHDAAIHRVTREWRPGLAADLEVEGRGGTSHRPVFAWLRENRPRADLLVAVTDGRTDLPERLPPGLDVVWVLVGETVREPDPGTAVRVDPGDPSV